MIHCGGCNRLYKKPKYLGTSPYCLNCSGWTTTKAVDRYIAWHRYQRRAILAASAETSSPQPPEIQSG